MQIKVRLFSVGGIPASDGSIIPRRVVEEYLNSDQYKKDIASRKMMGGLTHAGRNIHCNAKYPAAISKTVGKDDQFILVGSGISPTHVVDKFWINDEDNWVYALATVFDEKGMDDEAIQNVRRLRYLLDNQCLTSTSAVILGYWDTEGGKDTLTKLVSLKGFDITLNGSWKDSQVVETIDDNGKVIASLDTKNFSETEETKQGSLLVKEFSDVSVFGDYPKSSKVAMKFTKLKAKEFSSANYAEGIEENSISNNPITTEEKTFSVATVKERVRFAKLSPRMRFRRLFLDYKQAVKAAGGIEKIDEETLKVMKSLFATDCLDILKTITPEIQAGKPINTLIGASSLGKNVRVAAQKLMMPYKFALVEVSKRGVISPQRYKAIQAAYSEFISAMIDEVFGSNPIPEGLEEEINKEEEGK